MAPPRAGATSPGGTKRGFMRVLLLTVFLLAAGPARAGEALVAVATNFLAPAVALEEVFERETGHDIRLVSGSTGKLAAQILQGAPFDAFLAADGERPALLVGRGLAMPGSRFTYARGRLALWSRDPDRVGTDGRTTLAAGDFDRLALANPKLAPYGAAAREVIARLGLTEVLAAKLVLGENIGQAHAMVATGNAELGFVALSGLVAPGTAAGVSHWIVPEDLHAPIRQDAVLLARAAPDSAAAEFLGFLQGEKARAIIARHGYALE